MLKLMTATFLLFSSIIFGAESVEAYSKTLNQAVNEWMNEVSQSPSTASSDLYVGLGAALLEMGEPTWALLYLEKGIKFFPSNQALRSKRNEVLRVLMPDVPMPSVTFSEKFFSWLPNTSSKWMILASYGLLCATAGLALLVFRVSNWAVIFSSLAAFFTFGSLLCAAYFYYFTPIEGIVMKGQLLYRSSENAYAPVIEKLLMAGQKVQIIDSGAGWIKIITPDGQVGFIPQSVFKVI